MKIIPLGDSALIICGEFSQSLRATVRSLRAAEIPGVVDYAPSYDSIGVFFDPTRITTLSQHLQETLELSPATESSTEDANTIEIPVCYADDFAPDLDDVARHTGLSREEIALRHSGAHYTVACVGFLPGFGYLTGLPNELSTPRRAVPRKRVPVGSVAIGGGHTGVYPAVSPGGWNIIGRTPLRLFDAASNPPALLKAGDGVRFRSISREQFDESSC